MSFRYLQVILCALPLVVVQTASGSLPTSGGENNAWSLQSGAVATMNPNLTMGVAADEWYRLKRELVIQPMIAEGMTPNQNTPDGVVTLPPGTDVSIMEFSPDGQHVLIGVDEDISAANPGVDGSEPVIMWVRTSDLAQEPLELIDASADISEEWLETDVAARRGGRARGKKKMTFCMRDVRLFATKLTGKAIYADRAAVGYAAYKKAGWLPIKYAANNPIGTACFWGGGRTDCKGGACGHAAIKIGPNAWKGAGVRAQPGLPNKKGRVYIAHGCLVPPRR